MNIRFARTSAAALLMMFGLAACDTESNPVAVEVNDAATTTAAVRSGPTIVDIAVGLASDEENPEFTVLVAALKAAGLVDALNGGGQFTVFAPTDAAFLKAFEEFGVTPEEVLGNPEALEEVLLYHVAAGSLVSGDVLGAQKIRMLSGDFVFPVLNADGAFILDESPLTDDAQLLAPDLIDIMASNGVIHVIDEVLLQGDGHAPDRPDDGEGEGGSGDMGVTIADLVATLASDADNPEFTILLAALNAASLTSALDGEEIYTVFAPTDAAFLKAFEAFGVTPAEVLGSPEMLADVLLYHVTPGKRFSGDVLSSSRIETLNGDFVMPLANADGAFIVDGSVQTDDAQLLTPDLIDIEVSNGVVHVIDEVLLPGDYDMGGGDMGVTIAGLVATLASDRENPEFTILLAALEAAKLTAALDGEEIYTVFAPTDAAFLAAFEQLGTTAAEVLGNPEELANVLLYHVAPGKLLSGAVLGASEIRTLNGGFVFPVANDRGAFIVDGSPLTADARLLAPDLIDIVVSNGVVHVIDAVLLP